MFIDLPLKEQYEYFLNQCQSLFSIPREEMRSLVKEINDWEFSKDPFEVMKSPYMKKWMDSLGGKPAYDLYDDLYYLAAGWLSYKKWSRCYIKALRKHEKIFENVENLIDFGNGIGYSTLCFAELYPDINVFATNIKDSKQTKMGLNAAAMLLNVQYIYDYNNLPKANLLFCSEYFEHISSPIDHLDFIVKQTQPNRMIIANAFGTLAVGHFLDYGYGSDLLPAKVMSRKFNSYLKDIKYIRENYGFWNGRPAVWAKTIDE